MINNHLTITEAAKLLGKRRETILGHIKRGRISAIRDTSNARFAWLIPASELHKIAGLKPGWKRGRKRKPETGD